MASVRMCGVVLWSSPDDGRAVIWCEDHGKLAYYAEASLSHAVNDLHAGDLHAGVPLDAGDLIEFDVEDQDQQRRAHNPRLLVAEHAPCIAANLRGSALSQGALGTSVGPLSRPKSAKVVPFPYRSTEQHRAVG